MYITHTHIKPQAAKQVTNFLQTCDDPHRMCEALVDNHVYIYI